MKKLFKFLAVIAALVLITSEAWAVNTITKVGNVVTISAIDAAWTWTDTFTTAISGIRVQAIIFKPGAADDEFVMKNGSVSGPEFMPVKCADEYDTRGLYLGGAMVKPYFDFAASKITAGAVIVIILSGP